MADGFIQVPPDSGGKKVETTERARADGSIVERQRMEIPAGVTVGGDVILHMLIELRLISILLSQEFGVNDDLNQLRSDIAATEDLD